MKNQFVIKASYNSVKLMLCLILLLSLEANSQMIIKDLIPDTIVNDNEIYFLDLNNDGNPDFKFVHEDSASGLNGNGIGVKILHANAEFMGDQPPQDPSHWYPYKLKINCPIDSNASTMEWITQHPDPDMIRVLNLQFYNNTYAGQWVFGVVNHYLGVRLKINNRWHYGWILMDVVANATQMTIKSFAYRANPDSSVLAGEGLIFSTDSVSNIVGSDVADNANASDINVSFQKAANENTISEYRIIIVPVSFISSFNLNLAQSLSVNSYAAINPNGANVNITLDSNIRDAQGNPIAENIGYVAYVLCKADSNNSNTDFLSGPSPTFMLLNTNGIESQNQPNSFIVYFSDNAIKVNQIHPENLSLCLYNTSGKLVYYSSSSEQGISIPTIGLSNGLYFLRLISRNESSTRKLVIWK